MSALSLTRSDVLDAVSRHAAKRSGENKPVLRAQIEAQMADYIARGGRIETVVSPPIWCERAAGREAGTSRRYVNAPVPMSDLERVRAEKARRRQSGQRIVLPGSHDGAKPA